MKSTKKEVNYPKLPKGKGKVKSEPIVTDDANVEGILFLNSSYS